MTRCLPLFCKDFWGKIWRPLLPWPCGTPSQLPGIQILKTPNPETTRKKIKNYPPPGPRTPKLLESAKPKRGRREGDGKKKSRQFATNVTTNYDIL